VKVRTVNYATRESRNGHPSLEYSPTADALAAAPSKVFLLMAVVNTEEISRDPRFRARAPWRWEETWWLYLLHEVAHAYTGTSQKIGDEMDATVWARMVLATLYGPLSAEVKAQLRWDYMSAPGVIYLHPNDRRAWSDDNKLIGRVNTPALRKLATRCGLRKACGVKLVHRDRSLASGYDGDY
jgi:hypothetical protein